MWWISWSRWTSVLRDNLNPGVFTSWCQPWKPLRVASGRMSCDLLSCLSCFYSPWNHHFQDFNIYIYIYISSEYLQQIWIILVGSVSVVFSSSRFDENDDDIRQALERTEHAWSDPPSDVSAMVFLVGRSSRCVIFSSKWQIGDKDW